MPAALARPSGSGQLGRPAAAGRTGSQVVKCCAALRPPCAYGASVVLPPRQGAPGGGAFARRREIVCAVTRGGGGFGAAAKEPHEMTVPELKAKLKSLKVTEYAGVPLSKMLKPELVRAVEDATGEAAERTATKARKQQYAVTDVLAQLLNAHNDGTLDTVAPKLVGSYNEEFFMMGSAYMDMAKKEGNVDVITRMEAVMKRALKEKEATLRPEIRLLNQLLRVDVQRDRVALLQSEASTLATDHDYFFDLVAKMIKDVDGQKHNPQRREVVARLKKIAKEARSVANAAKN